jgi:hypothetical protein
LSIHGACRETKSTSLQANDCTVAVSREQFEVLMSLLAPGGATPAAKYRIARKCAELLAFDSVARDSGIDSSLQYQATMRWLEAKTLADLLRRRLEKESGTVSESELESYYHEHPLQFEEVRLRRLVLPKSNFAVADRRKAERDARRIAAELRERAVQGEDVERLQKEGYLALGFNGLHPATDAGIRRRASLPSEVSEEIFSLRPGEVSKVENETYSFVIYKVEAKRRLLKEQVTEEISREVAKEKLDRALKSITGRIRTDLNEEYFGTGSGQQEEAPREHGL